MKYKVKLQRLSGEETSYSHGMNEIALRLGICCLLKPGEQILSVEQITEEEYSNRAEARRKQGFLLF